MGNNEYAQEASRFAQLTPHSTWRNWSKLVKPSCYRLLSLDAMSHDAASVCDDVLQVSSSLSRS